MHDAFSQLNILGHTEAAAALQTKAEASVAEAGVVTLAGTPDGFIQAAQRGRIWDRECAVRQVN